MVAIPAKSRLAIGIYDDVLGFARPVSALLDLGVVPDQFGFLALQSTVQRLLRPTEVSVEAWNVLGPMLLNTEVLTKGPGTPQIVASRGITDLIEFGPSKSWSLNHLVAGNTGSRSLTTVHDHIRQGRAALAVASETCDQQWQIARELLKSSSYPVETHEFGQGG